MPNTSGGGIFFPRMGTNNLIYGYILADAIPKKPIKPKIITEGKSKRKRSAKKGK